MTIELLPPSEDSSEIQKGVSQVEKKKILVISDHPFSPSGVGTQTKYFIEALLATGRYKFICLGGAVKHKDYTPVKTQEHGEDLIVIPIDGYGSPDLIRQAVRKERPSAVWIMTDPRFWHWLWEIEEEIRYHCSLIYYHVWDNYPYPYYNKKYYESNDAIATISKVTADIVTEVAPKVKHRRIPHAVPNELFKQLPPDVVAQFKQDNFKDDKDKFMVVWNNRNARRKQSGSLIFWFKKFLDKVGHDKAVLIMHTDTKDPNGQDLDAIITELGLTDGQVKFSREKVPPHALSLMYNAADVVINISDAEGFGLATLEALSCGTPIIVSMTGGLQEQVTDGEKWFGIGIEPASKAIIGSQEIPFIREDRLDEDDVVNALLKMFEMSAEERQELGQQGIEHVKKNYSFEVFNSAWVEFVDEVLEENGAWGTRKDYKSWEMFEL